MKYIKKFIQLFESEEVKENPITYETIISKYFPENVDIYNTYKFKWLLTKKMEYYKFINKDQMAPGLELLNKYIGTIKEKDGKQLIEDYNSDWAKFLDVKLPKDTTTYSSYVGLKVWNVYKKDYHKEYGMIATNIGIFKEALTIVNSKLPKGYKFFFGGMKSVSTIDNKDLIKALIYFNVFNDDSIKKWVEFLNKMHKVTSSNDEYFIQYMKDKFNINVTKASLKDDVAGIDFIADDGTTYQLKYAAGIVVYKTGYFIPKTSQLDIKSIDKCDKLALYDKNKNIFYILDIDALEFNQGDKGLFIKITF